jgi:hypothetical protein
VAAKNRAPLLLAFSPTFVVGKFCDLRLYGARDCLPQRAGGQAHLGKIFGGEGDGDHGRATFK